MHGKQSNLASSISKYSAVSPHKGKTGSRVRMRGESRLSMSESSGGEEEEVIDSSGRGFGKKVEIKKEEQVQLRKTETRKGPNIEFKSVGTAVENSENDNGGSNSRNLYVRAYD